METGNKRLATIRAIKGKANRTHRNSNWIITGKCFFNNERFLVLYGCNNIHVSLTSCGDHRNKPKIPSSKGNAKADRLKRVKGDREVRKMKEQDKATFVRTHEGYDIYGIAKQEGESKFKKVGRLKYSISLDEWTYVKAWKVNEMGADALEQVTKKIRELDKKEKDKND